MENTVKNKVSFRKKLNERVYKLGALKISLVHLILLIIINLSLASIIVNLFVRGTGILEWWSFVVTASLIFSYLVLRIFTSTGIILGRQVTFLITLFNVFLNLMKTFGMVESNQHWELTFLIPLVNLICLVFLVFVFIVRKKKFRAIIIPSLKIALVSIIPIVRLYFIMDRNYILPVFNYVVMILAFALFINALFLNWLTIMKIAEDNIQMIKKGADEFKKASQKVATVNKKIDSFNSGMDKVKSFWKASGLAFKEFFTFKKNKQTNIESQPIMLIEENKNSLIDDDKEKLNVTIETKQENNKRNSVSKVYDKIKDKLKINKEPERAAEYDNAGEMVLCDKAENDRLHKESIYNKLIKPFKSKK